MVIEGWALASLTGMSVLNNLEIFFVYTDEKFLTGSTENSY